MAEGLPGDSVLAYLLTPRTGFAPVQEGDLVSLDSGSILVDHLSGVLSESGRSLRVQVGYEESLSRQSIDTSGTIKIAQTVSGVFFQGSHSVTDQAGNTGPSDRLAFASNPITLTPRGGCSGFPDGGLFFRSRNCTSSDDFQFNSGEDHIRVIVEGAGLRDFLDQPGTGISLNQNFSCAPETELDFTSHLTPFVYSSQASLSFQTPESDEASFRVCLLSSDLSLIPPQEIAIRVSVDFEAWQLADTEVQSARFSIIPRCFGDLNGDYRVNNADALLLKSCFPCEGPDCDRRCDSDLDGSVNNRDWLEFYRNFGQVCEGPKSNPYNYPYLANYLMIFREPAGIVLLASFSVAGFSIFAQFLIRRRERDEPHTHPGAE
ncbi:MAG: hypothetical protein CL917_14885 [Deltaproteobacteria bacterium]|nr:hypothetical protein [Deltaproteobacteria bacterium]